MRAPAKVVLPAVLVSLVACTAERTDDSLDAGADATMRDAGDGTDAGDPADGGDDAGCTGACRAFTLTAGFGGKAYPFERAQFGLTAPERSASGGWELYLEAHAGGAATCPDESSPTPQRTLVLAGLALPWDGSARTRADGVSLALLDFRGDLTEEPILRASDVTVSARFVEPCLDCETRPAEQQVERIVALDIEATFPGGTLGGSAYALHCASLDDR